MDERRIPFIKWGHLLRFAPAKIEVWIDAHRYGSGLGPAVPFELRRRSAQTVPTRDR